jgi:hypothetical protein
MGAAGWQGAAVLILGLGLGVPAFAEGQVQPGRSPRGREEVPVDARILADLEVLRDLEFLRQLDVLRRIEEVQGEPQSRGVKSDEKGKP